MLERCTCFDAQDAYGADAVYAGLPRYSLRVRNNDFLEDNLAVGIREAHGLGRLFYLACNVMPHGAKLKTFVDDLAPVIDEAGRLRLDTLVVVGVMADQRAAVEAALAGQLTAAGMDPAEAQAAAARAVTVLSRGSIRVGGSVARIDPDLCSGCLGCINVCPYGAITFDSDEKVAIVNAAVCKGCGACAAACPSEASAATRAAASIPANRMCLVRTPNPLATSSPPAMALKSHRRRIMKKTTSITTPVSAANPASAINPTTTATDTW